MYSYPNLISIPAGAINQILKAVEPFPYDRIYGVWWDYKVLEDAKAAVASGSARYLDAIKREWFPVTAPQRNS